LLNECAETLLQLVATGGKYLPMALPSSAAPSTTVMTIGGHRVPADVMNAVQRAASRTGVDFSYLMSQAAQESGFRNDARAQTSSATGLFQFIDSTWLAMVRDHGAKYGLAEYADAIEGLRGGPARVSDPNLRRRILDLRYNADVSAAMAAEYAASNKAHLERSLGRSVGAADLYMAHFLGAAGAARFLSTLASAPGTSAAEVAPAAAAANTNVFYERSGRAFSVREVYDRMAQRIESRAAEVARAGDQRVLRLFAARSTSPIGYVANGIPAIQANAGNVAGSLFANLSHLSPTLAPETTVALARINTSLPSAGRQRRAARA
jgi:hypothetical protein